MQYTLYVNVENEKEGIVNAWDNYNSSYRKATEEEMKDKSQFHACYFSNHKGYIMDVPNWETLLERA